MPRAVLPADLAAELRDVRRDLDALRREDRPSGLILRDDSTALPRLIELPSEFVVTGGVEGRIHSDNYEAGVAGWEIRGDGSAEFQEAVVRGQYLSGTTPPYVQIDDEYIKWVSAHPTEDTSATLLAYYIDGYRPLLWLRTAAGTDGGDHAAEIVMYGDEEYLPGIFASGSITLVTSAAIVDGREWSTEDLLTVTQRNDDVARGDYLRCYQDPPGAGNITTHFRVDLDGRVYGLGTNVAGARAVEVTPRVAIKTADETVTSSQALQNDDELVVAVEANSVYELVLCLRYAGHVDGRLRFDLTVPAGATLAGFLNGALDDASTAVTGAGAIHKTRYLTASDTVTVGAVGTGTAVACVVVGLVTVGATAGNVRVRWAQAASHATATTVKPSSFLLLRGAAAGA